MGLRADNRNVSVHIKTVMRQLISSSELLQQCIVAIYLFGSTVSGKAHDRSDIDIAFLFDRAFYKKDPFYAVQEAEMLSVKIAGEMQKPIDAIVINSVSLSFAYHILRQGLCVYQRKSSERILFEVAIENEYHDFAPFIKELRETKRRALVGGN